MVFNEFIQDVMKTFGPLLLINFMAPWCDRKIDLFKKRFLHLNINLFQSVK